MATVVYQSGERVERTGWYEPVGVTRPLASAPLTTVVKLDTGTAFPDWKGRAICWRLYAVDANDIPQNNAASQRGG
jgi:hypothetical protein